MKKNKIRVFYYQEMMSSEEAKRILEKQEREQEIKKAVEEAVKKAVEEAVKKTVEEIKK